MAQKNKIKSKKSFLPIKPVVLLILDGFGLGDVKLPGNAVTSATAPNIFSYFKKYPNSKLKAHGRDVGLFPGQEGNSEAGHFNIGAGRIVKQDLVRISEAIKDGTFYKNEAFLHAIREVLAKHSTLHIMGLLTNGQSAHAHPEHLFALLELARRHKVPKVVLHLCTDGRDSSPHSAIMHLRRLKKFLFPHETIATVTGRFYGMDRNKIWNRTEVFYRAVVDGKGEATAESAEEAITAGYNRGETDEYLVPTVITKHGQPIATIQNNDAVIYFNARSDRARQITKALVQPDFNKRNPGAFRRHHLPHPLCFVAMTDFGPDLPGVLTAFPSPDVVNGLVASIDHRYRHLYISETEKYAHVTYFFNGGYSDAINGETRELIPSGDTYSYADKPAMQSAAVGRRVVECVQKNLFDFITVNFPNADMVGHTGDWRAACRGIKAMDKEVAKIVKVVLKKQGAVIITADHGNAEKMYTGKTGAMETEHSTAPVPFMIICDKLRKLKAENGRLADIAPTILTLLSIPKPKEMTGKTLLNLKKYGKT